MGLPVDQLFLLHSAGDEPPCPLLSTCPEIPEVDEEQVFSASSSDAKDYPPRKFSSSGLDRYTCPPDSEAAGAETKDTDDKPSDKERKSEGWTRSPKPLPLTLEDPDHSLKSSPSIFGCVRHSIGTHCESSSHTAPNARVRMPSKEADSPYHLHSDRSKPTPSPLAAVQDPNRKPSTHRLDPLKNRGAFFAPSDKNIDVSKVWETVFSSKKRTVGLRTGNRAPQRSRDGIHSNARPATAKNKSSGCLTERIKAPTALR